MANCSGPKESGFSRTQGEQSLEILPDSTKKIVTEGLVGVAKAISFMHQRDFITTSKQQQPVSYSKFSISRNFLLMLYRSLIISSLHIWMLLF